MTVLQILKEKIGQTIMYVPFNPDLIITQEESVNIMGHTITPKQGIIIDVEIKHYAYYNLPSFNRTDSVMFHFVLDNGDKTPIKLI